MRSEEWDERTDRLIDRIRAAGGLTTQELRIVEYLSHGLSGPMVADAMYLSPHTVTDYMKSIRLKMASKTTTQACCEALRLGLIR